MVLEGELVVRPLDGAGIGIRSNAEHIVVLGVLHALHRDSVQLSVLTLRRLPIPASLDTLLLEAEDEADDVEAPPLELGVGLGIGFGADVFAFGIEDCDDDDDADDEDGFTAGAPPAVGEVVEEDGFLARRGSFHVVVLSL